MYRRATVPMMSRLLALGIAWGAFALSANAALTHHYPIESESAGSLTDVVGGVDLFYTDVDNGTLSTDVVIPGSTQSFELVAGRTAGADFPDELFQAASFSTALWYREGTGGGGNPTIVGVIDEASGNFQHNFLIRDAAGGGGNLRLFSRDNSGNTIDVVSDTQINDGQWHHLAATFDSSTLAANLYVDGNLTGTGTFTGWTGWNQFEQSFGGLGNPGASLSGTYDDVRFYNNAITPSEVEALANVVAVLEIDRQTGTIDLINDSGSAISIAGYTISSAAGALVDSNWVSVTDNYDGNDGAEIDSSNWSIQTSSKTDLTESADSPGSGSIADAATFRLGDPGAWLANPVEDLNIEISLNGGGTFNPVTRFVGTAISNADINGSGIVDDGDWLVFRGNLNGPALDPGLTAAELFRAGDIDGDFDVDRSDFVAFKNAFIAATSVEAFASLEGVTVPEPSSAVLALMTLSLSSLVLRRYRST